MVFSTLTFLYAFLPLVLVSYFLFPNRVYRNGVLLVFSLVFYAWGEPRYIFLMLAASFVAYIGGLLIHQLDGEKTQKLRKVVFVITICLLTANLFLFKYLNFTVDNLNHLFSSTLMIPKIALPIGISFYTFQILSYVIDLYRHEIQVQTNYFYLTLYVSFFPQLIAGPIVRYQTVESEIKLRKESLEDVSYGLRRFIVGLSKKVILSNKIGAIATLIYTENTSAYGTAIYWLAALAYSLQIYFDFSGYSDMAIGLGRIFGFHFLENFHYPYIATSITDFWRRWHISLSSWFRDYIYIPLGGNRCSTARWVFNLCVVWVLTGFWHGAQWNFMLWGIYYAVLLLVEKFFLGKLLERLPKIFQWLYTFFFVVIGWVIFNAESLEQVGQRVGMLFRFVPSDPVAVLAANSSILLGLIYIPIGLVCMLPWAERIKLKKTALRDTLLNVVCLVLLLECIVYILSSSYNPFIYFRF